MARPKTNYEQMPARFADGTFGRIDAVRKPGENRADFLRAAVEFEVKRRSDGSACETPNDTGEGIPA